MRRRSIKASRSVSEGNLKKRDVHRALTVAAESLSAPAWGCQHNHGLFIYCSTQSMLHFTLLGVSSTLLPQSKELGFNLQSFRSAAREHHLLFRIFVGEAFFRREREKIFQFLLVLV